jgi:hypothetical protein
VIVMVFSSFRAAKRAAEGLLDLFRADLLIGT